MTCSNANNYVQRGNTVRLIARFKDWDDEPINPGEVKIIIYDRRWNRLFDQVLTSDPSSEVGRYHFDYIPDAVGVFYIEWQGRLDGQPSLYRTTLTVRDL